jgi:hypothetical protein
MAHCSFSSKSQQKANGDEHGAALLCGIATSDRGTRLLVRDVALAHDGVDYVPGTRGYRHLTGEFVSTQVRRARDQGLVYLAVHNHGGTTSVGFSGPDRASHERGYPTMLQLTKRPVGALVLAQRAVAGELWLPGGTRADVARTVVVGTRRQVLTAEPDRREPAIAARYDRQSLLFGAAGQGILAESKVAVVGAGGVGMLLVQFLARLGVGHLLVIDPQRVEPSNLPRLPEASRLDAMEYLDHDGVPILVRRAARRVALRKVRLAHRIARRANATINFEGVAGDVAHDHVARRITNCDFIFLAADTMLARNVVNQIAYQYLVPTLQVGSKAVVHRTTGQILDVYSVVRTLGTGPGCMWCNGLIDPVRLSEESVGDRRQALNQRYVDDPDVHAPSVITLNGIGAAWAADDYLHFMVGLERPGSGFRLLRTKPVTAEGPHVTVQDPAADPDCFVCGGAPRAVRAMGNDRDIPTRLP